MNDKINKICQECQQPFQADRTHAYVKLCFACYKERSAVQEETQATPLKAESDQKIIVRQVLVKAAAQVLPKRISADKFMQYVNELEKEFWNYPS